MTHDPDISTAAIPETAHTPTQDDAPALEAASTAEHAATDLAGIRELVLRAHPDVVPELITGETVSDLLASIEAAEAAYRRVSESLRTSSPGPSPSPPAVPAGGDRPMPVDPERLPASEKIRRGLAHR